MTNRNGPASFPAALAGLAVALLGFGCFSSGRQVTLKWSVISAAYAGYGVLWMIGGAAMILGGLWVLGSRGRRRFPLWAGALGSVLAGTSLVIGVLTYVVPCAGPG